MSLLDNKRLIKIYRYATNVRFHGRSAIRKVRSEGKVVFDCEISDSGEVWKRSWLIQAKAFPLSSLSLSLSLSNAVFQLKTISSDSSGERVIQFTARWAKLTSLIPQNQPGTIHVPFDLSPMSTNCKFNYFKHDDAIVRSCSTPTKHIYSVPVKSIQLTPPGALPVFRSNSLAIPASSNKISFLSIRFIHCLRYRGLRLRWIILSNYLTGFGQIFLTTNSNKSTKIIYTEFEYTECLS